MSKYHHPYFNKLNHEERKKQLTLVLVHVWIGGALFLRTEMKVHPCLDLGIKEDEGVGEWVTERCRLLLSSAEK